MSETRTIPVSPSAAALPTFTVKIDGNAVPRTLSIISAVVTREVNKIPRLHLVIQDGLAATSDFPASNEAFFVPGKSIELWVGYSMQEGMAFKGIIIKHSIRIRQSGSPLLLVQAADKAIAMTASPQRKYFTDIKDSDVFNDLANAYGLEADIEQTIVTHGQLMQFYCSDWDFIQTRAEVNGKLCFCENGKLVIKKPVLDAKPVLQLLYGATIIELDAEMDAMQQYSEVRAYSWNPADQKLAETSGNEPQGLKEQGNVNAQTLSAVAKSKPYPLTHSGNLNEQEQQVWADALLLKSRLSKIKGRASFNGYRQIMPGQIVSLAGLGNRFNGPVFVSGIRHEIEGGYWKTNIQFGLSHKWFAAENDVQPLPASGMAPAVKGLQIGVVVQLEKDAAGEFRIKVKIPVVDMNGEGIWCRVSMPDAGKERGFFFLPEIGDEVVVAFLNEDPAHPVVLGCLYSSAKPAKITPSDDNHQKGIISRSGMQWLWDDDKKTFLADTPAGNKILLSEDEKLLKLEDQNGNKITMNSDGISIESPKAIVLKAGTDIKAEASANAEVKGASAKFSGDASAELSSGGSTTVKGSMVMIN